MPVAAYEAGIKLTVQSYNGSTDYTIKVDGVDGKSDQEIAITAESNRYVKLEFASQVYLAGIKIEYVKPYPGTPASVEAKDKSYTLNNTMSLTDVTGNTVTQIQSGKGIAGGDIKVDASAGKFAPRNDSNNDSNNDVQITAGTTLYIPVAPDAKDATILVSGNNYDNLTLRWQQVTASGEAVGSETSISVGKETVFTTPAEPAYYALTFTGTSGSCYATGITIDYRSDDSYTEKTVTVGADKEYQTITAALEANTSSAKDRLILQIDPGRYNERVIVDNPYVTLKNAGTGEVVIHERYYSSNMRNPDGSYAPQDEHDLGTAECGTVIVKSTATGFRAEGITFQNDYNMTVNTEEGTQTPAVALNTRADKVVLEQCKILGRQDTFYPQGAGCRVYLNNCYIEGTVDFIFGDADAYFNQCQIHMAAFTGRDSGYFVAPNTKLSNTGLVFYDCTLTVDESYTNAEKISLGRPWQTECESTMNARNEMISYYPDTKKAGYENLGSAATFIACEMSDTIKSSRFSSWTRKLHKEDGTTETVAVSYDRDVRFAEINSRTASGQLIAQPTALTPSTTRFETGLTAEAAAARANEKMKAMGMGAGTTWSDVAAAVPVGATAYTVTAGTCENGSVTVDKATAEAGETVTITATAATGYEVDKYVVNNVEQVGNTFVMPAEAVTVAATFKKVVISSGGSSSGGGSASSGGGSSYGGGSYISNYPVQVAGNQEATVTANPSNAKAGDTVTLTVQTETGKKASEVLITTTAGKQIAVKTVDATRLVLQIGSKTLQANADTCISDVAPVIDQHNRTLVPLRIITETLGGKVDWNAATRTVTLQLDGKKLSMTIDQIIPGFDSAAVILNGRTMVPIRYIMEALGADVEWDAASRRIVIEK